MKQEANTQVFVFFYKKREIFLFFLLKKRKKSLHFYQFSVKKFHKKT